MPIQAAVVDDYFAMPVRVLDVGRIQSWEASRPADLPDEGRVSEFRSEARRELRQLKESTTESPGDFRYTSVTGLPVGGFWLMLINKMWCEG